MNIIENRAGIFARRIDSESESLLYDIAQIENLLSADSAIHHHVEQFEAFATRILVDKLESLYDSKYSSELDQPTFNSVIISLLTSKWVRLRQVALQRAPGNPYLSAIRELDKQAEDGYERLRQVLQEMCELKKLSSSPPLVYLGPIARFFLFDEEAPSLISTPFGAVNEQNEFARVLSRQTIPHEVAHAIFEEIPDLLEEVKLRVKMDMKLAMGEATKKQSAIDSVIFNWLDEIIADMAGTALGGEDFARSAAMIMVMPEKMVGISDDTHPVPLLRPFIHAKTLKKLAPDSAQNFYQSLNKITSEHLNKRFESLPVFVNVSMEELRDRLDELTDYLWDSPLNALSGHTLGQVLTATAEKKIPEKRVDQLPEWGKAKEGEKEEDVLLRLIDSIDLVSPLPSPKLFESIYCCLIKLQSCCSTPIM